MNTYLAFGLLAFVAVASADPPLPVHIGHVATVETISNPNYAFNYAVNDPSTGDNKAQWESRHGGVVKGAYSLVEPDGNIRTVEYFADSLHGFNAIVKRTGPNVHSYAPVAKVVEAAPVVATAPVAIAPEPILYDHAPIVHHAPIAPIVHEPIAPIVHAPIAPIAHAPIAPIAHGPIYDAPLLAPGYDLPLLSHDHGPWLRLHGATYGHKGHILDGWAAGPISLDGKTVTIRTKH